MRGHKSRFRPQFDEWSATLEVRYSPEQLTAEQIVQLFNTAGVAIGLGDWRPEFGGNFGMFEVTNG